MDFIKNMPEIPGKLADMIAVRPGRVISMSLSKVEGVSMMLFAFAEGEGVKAEIYPGDMWYFCVEGSMLLCKDGEEYPMKVGDCVAVKAGEAHALKGPGAFKMLQIMLQN